ncbi:MULTISPECIES: zinc ribbon-containing protein [Corallincola]|uniref:Zinc ribbon-containing protein n=3 Tax=Corallincola TaxID=1775176 RepID=A0A368NHF8_9GAMM|nr:MULTISPECIES: hypothetical protein [Corallincola]RCU48821.1 hypothetical protein DU002_13615 [Corallincola holothuriorum]TAA43716.1 hypothetical protein EXY25_14290 [Corallincola spongiicola]TCI02963.1 hypothetical protein EZV61_11790 [Corallincola luteus]
MSDEKAPHSGYQKLVDELKAQMEKAEKFSEEEVHEWVEKATAYLQAAGELSKDELQLMSTYLKRDFATAAERMKHLPDSWGEGPALESFKQSAWRWMLELTDRTQLEWSEVADDLKHQGVYKVGEWISLGILICHDCGKAQEFSHPEQIDACPHCGGEAFNRQPFDP